MSVQALVDVIDCMAEAAGLVEQAVAKVEQAQRAAASATQGRFWVKLNDVKVDLQARAQVLDRVIGQVTAELEGN